MATFFPALAFALATLFLAHPALAQEVYELPEGQETRWISPENPSGAKGAGARENRGGKGHAFETIPIGGALTLADIKGRGIIDRIWMTIEDRSPEALRGLKIEMFWDSSAVPAVSVPLGDFFLHGAGEMTPMETELFASPEGRSFVSYVKMPFRRSARITVTNESGKPVNLIFFDLNYRAVARRPKDAWCFHAWRYRGRPP